MKKIYFTIILLVTLLPFANCFSTEGSIINPNRIQLLVDNEVGYQLATMKSTVLKALFDDIPAYSIHLKVNENSKVAGELGPPTKQSLISINKKYHLLPTETGNPSVFVGEININQFKHITQYWKDSLVKKAFDNTENNNLTAVINAVELPPTITPQKFSEVFAEFSNDPAKFFNYVVDTYCDEGEIKNKKFKEEIFGKVIIDQTTGQVDTSYIDKLQDSIDKKKNNLPNENEFAKRKENLAERYKKLNNQAADEISKYNADVNEYNNQLKELENVNKLQKEINKWKQNHREWNCVHVLKRLRSTVIHELCHPLTAQFYSGFVDKEAYCEGVNIRIACAYEISQGYHKSAEEYLSFLYGKEHSYRTYYNTVDNAFRGNKNSTPTIPTFIELIYLNNESMGINPTPEDTLEIAFDTINAHNNSKNDDDKKALREILKQYVVADTANERNTAVDELLKHKIGTNEFHLICLYKDGKYVYKKNGTRYYYAIKSSDKLTGIAYCEIIESDVNKGSSRKIHRLKFENWKLDSCDVESFEGGNLYTEEKEGKYKLIFSQEIRAVLEAQKQINSK